MIMVILRALLIKHFSYHLGRLRWRAQQFALDLLHLMRIKILIPLELKLIDLITSQVLMEMIQDVFSRMSIQMMHLLMTNSQTVIRDVTMLRMSVIMLLGWKRQTQ